MSNLSKQNNSLKSFFFLVILFFSTGYIFSQDKTIFSINKNPVNQSYWWLEKNNYGQSTNKVNFESSVKFRKSKKTYVINLFTIKNNRGENKLLFNESYIKHNFSENSFLKVGRYYRDFSKYLDEILSSGSMLISYNAQAMPKIGFVSSQKINKKIYFDYGISHAIFEKNQLYISPPFLHEKFLYLNLIKEKNLFSIGIVHEAMWGGTTLRLGEQPDSFKDFVKVFFSADGNPIEGEPHTNAIGNHLGIWDFSYQTINNNKIFKLYYQHIFEDTSGLRFANKTDGLWGLELKNYVPKTTLLLEYVSTKHQNINPPYVQESYYNHGIYDLGWTYKNYVLGSPFIQNTNSSNIEDNEILYLATSFGFLSKYQSVIKLSKRINKKEGIKYKIHLVRDLKSKGSIGLFIVNNENDIGTGIIFNKYL